MTFDIFRESTAEALDTVDAALFSGDEFFAMKKRVALREVLARWSAQLNELDLSESLEKDE